MITHDRLDDFRQQADPLADDAVRQLVAVKGPQEAMRLFHLLIRNIRLPLEELPGSLDDFLAQTQSLPPWIDFPTVEKAHRLFLDHGPKFLILLYYQSLPILYACANGAVVLESTGRLAKTEDQFGLFTRRIAETGQFLVDVMTQEGLKEGGLGIEAIQKVRLIHASIRFFLRENSWDTATLGLPINQEDMAITLQTFSSVPLQGIEQLGIVLSAEEKENYYHCWRGIGCLMGVNEELLPATQDEGFRLHQQILDRQGATSAAGHQLTQALLRFAEATIPKTILDDAPEALMRYLVGPDTAQLLGVTPPQGCLSNLFPHALGKFFAWGEKLEDRSLPFSSTMDIVSRQLTLAMVNFFNEYKQTYFRIPESMQVAWDIASSGD
jgi:hypothetical protein